MKGLVSSAVLEVTLGVLGRNAKVVAMGGEGRCQLHFRKRTLRKPDIRDERKASG
jgi:hypothetical protein